MGLSTGPTLGDAFLCFYEKKRPGQCQVDFRLVYQGYVYVAYEDDHHSSIP